MCNYYCDDNGFVTEQLKEYVRSQGQGGGYDYYAGEPPWNAGPGPVSRAVLPLYLDG